MKRLGIGSSSSTGNLSQSVAKPPPDVVLSTRTSNVMVSLLSCISRCKKMCFYCIAADGHKKVGLNQYYLCSFALILMDPPGFIALRLMTVSVLEANTIAWRPFFFSVA